MSEDTGSQERAVESPGGAGTVTFKKVTAVRGLLALHLVAMVAAFLPASVPGVVTAPPVVFALTFVPGGLAVLLLYEDLRVSARTLLYAMGLSLISLLAMGFTINIFLLRVDIEAPLAKGPLGISVTLLVGILYYFVRKRTPDGVLEVSLPLPLTPGLVAAALLPFLGILSMTYLNATANNGPILVLLGIFAVIPLVAVLRSDARIHPYLVYFLALAISYHKSFWKNFGFSGSPGVVRTWQEQQWNPGITEVDATSTSLLQNGVLFPTYARLSGISIITELEVVNPFLIAFIPLAVYVVARHYFGSRHGLLAAALFSFAHPFYIQYPTAGRAATPVLFLSLFAVVLSEQDLSTVRTSLLGLLFVSGIVVSHYGTSYFVMFAILGALSLLVVIRILDDVVDQRFDGIVTDGGQVVGDQLRSYRESRSGHSALSWTLAFYYTVGAIGWYMYATQGNKYKTLPNHILSTFYTFMGEEIVSGRTGARIQRDYGSQSIRISKVIYISIGIMMGIGLLYTFYRRFIKDDRSLVDDHYVVMASVMLAIFGSTFVARNWGGGRPMMITFTFTGAFSVLGALVLAKAGRSAKDRFELNSIIPTSGPCVSGGFVVFGLILVLLFSLNTGLAGTLVFDSSSPSNVPFPESQDSDRELDISGHIWINEHGEGNVYGDPITHGQTDWLRPEIAVGMGEGQPYVGGIDKPRGDLPALRNKDIGPGYILLLSHNVENEAIVQRYSTENIPFSEYQGEFESRNRIYSTGLSAVYYEPSGERTEEGK